MNKAIETINKNLKYENDGTQMVKASIARGAILDLGREIDRLNYELQTYNENYRDLQTINSELQDEINLTIESLQRLTKEHKELQEKLDEAEGYIKDLETDKKKLDSLREYCMEQIEIDKNDGGYDIEFMAKASMARVILIKLESKEQ